MFSSFLKDQLDKPGKKCLLIGENHYESLGLNVLKDAIPDIKLSGAKVIVVTEALPQLKSSDYSAYTLKSLPKNLTAGKHLILSALIQAGVVLYGCEDTYSNPILGSKETTKKQLLDKLVKDGVLKLHDQEMDLLNQYISNKFLPLEDFQVILASMYADSIERLARGNKVFSDCMVKVTKACKNQKVLCIFVGGSKHIPEVTKEDKIIEPGMLMRVNAEFKCIDSSDSPMATACFVTHVNDDKSKEYLPDADQAGEYGVIKNLFIIPRASKDAFFKDKSKSAEMESAAEIKPQKPNSGCNIM